MSKRFRKAEFDEKTNPNVKSFWDNIAKADNPDLLAKHPFYALYGKELAQSGRGAYKDFAPPADLRQRLRQIIEIEQEYKHTLEKMAIQIVSEIWGAPKELFEAHLGFAPMQEADEGSDDESESEPEQEDVVPENLRKEINKRVTINTLTHGAAVHQMQTAHHLVRDALNEIDEQLVPLYTAISKDSHSQYWEFFFEDMAKMTGGGGEAAGTSRIKYDEEGNPKIIAYGMFFPILVQELSKGMMELLSMHGHAKLDPHVQREVLKHADDLKHEQWMIQVGPTLWQRFLKVLPKGIPLAEVIAAFGERSADEIEEIVEATIDHPEKAQQILSRVVQARAYLRNIRKASLKRLSAPIVAEPEIEEPQVQPRTVPRTPSPQVQPTPKRDPFRPPRPAEEPKPKARQKRMQQLAKLTKNLR